MSLIPIKLPAGIYRTGTELDGTGRWIEANLVRWQHGSLRPVGGWGERDDISASLTSKPRAAHAWIDNTLGANQAYGSANELIYVNESGTATDITPTGFNTGNEDAAINIGFGGGFYGTGAWSYRRESADTFQEADTWSLDNWGEYLVGCSTSDGKLYEWTLNTSNPAAQIANSPESCKGLIATEERFIFALQADGNPRKIAWCDREDNTTWTPLATNEAGDIELQTNGEIMCGLRMRGRTLIITNVDAHIASYQGAPYVYGFERVGTACGVVARKAAIAVDQGAFWMGAEGFYLYDGSVAKNLPCEVWDGVFEDINENQISKTFAVHNSEHGEVWWFYPSAGSIENDSYVAYDYIQGHWALGKINRTCGFDKGVFPKPTWVGTDRKTYTHELHGAGHGAYTPYVESSPIQLGNGDQVMKVNQLISDEATNSEVKVQFKTKFYPNDTEYVYPSESTYYTLGNQPTGVRFTGRSIAIRIEANTDNDWRVGTMRVNAEAGGRR
jgi:hypothetical protein